MPGLRSVPLLVERRAHAHPHEAVARALAAAPDGAELLFNYRSRFNEIWDDDGLRERHAYSATYPADGSAGLAVTV